MTFRSNVDILGFALVPVGSIIGSALACKWEFLGGAVAVASMAALLAMRPDRLRVSFIVLTLIALLYIWSGWLPMWKGKTARA